MNYRFQGENRTEEENMFEWKIEDLVLMNNNHIVGRVKYYNCETKVLREDKIAFVDSMTDGKLSYILGLLDQFQKDKDNLPKQTSMFGNESVKTVSLKAWIKRNDTKYSKPIIDDWYHYGMFNLLGSERSIQTNYKGTYDTYEDLVDEAFHRQLLKCEEQERKYFLEHDEYSILKTKLREYQDKYRTSFGVNILTCSSGEISIYDGEDYKTSREITMDELKDLITKYEQVDVLIGKLTEETHIVY